LYYKIISYKIDYLKYLILLKITKGSVLKRVLLGSFLMYGVVFATVSDIFPDVLSSGSGINFNSKAEIEGSGEELMTPSMLNKNKAKCDGVFCQMSGEAPEALKSFKFLESNSKGKLEVTEDMTFLDSDLGSTEIKGDNLTITFDAPEGGFLNRRQSIASIKDYGKNTTFIFRAGDYHIGEFESIQNDKKIKDRVELKSDGAVRLYIKDSFTIEKNTNSDPKNHVVVINSNRSAKEFLIFSKGNFKIDTIASFDINFIIYGYSAIELVGAPQSLFHGAINAKGELNIGNKKAIGEFVYDKEAVEGLYSAIFKDNLLAIKPNDPKREGKKTIEGIDANRNSIRDDVELYIVEQFGYSQKIMALAIQYARAYQYGLNIAYSATHDEAYEWRAGVVDEARLCKNYIVSDDRGYWILNELKDKVTNTRVRLKGLFKIDAKSSGVYPVGTDSTTWKLKCSFNPDEMEN